MTEYTNTHTHTLLSSYYNNHGLTSWRTPGWNSLSCQLIPERSSMCVRLRWFRIRTFKDPLDSDSICSCYMNVWIFVCYDPEQSTHSSTHVLVSSHVNGSVPNCSRQSGRQRNFLKQNLTQQMILSLNLFFSVFCQRVERKCSEN